MCVAYCCCLGVNSVWDHGVTLAGGCRKQFVGIRDALVRVQCYLVPSLSVICTSGRLSEVFGLLRVCQQTLGHSTNSALSFSPQIRFFAKTYTLTPYNGAEAHVSSSQLDFNSE